MQIFDDVACTVCGCVCDDLQITVDGGRIVKADGACHLAEPWFLEQETRQPPAARIDGQEVAVEQAVARAAEILRDARYPLIYGLSRSSTPGQRAAIRLADQLAANVDTTASLCHAPSIMAIQQNGESTCSLGEIRNRADLVMFWGVDPVNSHPRHMERYSADPVGMFLPGGRSDRTVIVVDHEANDTSQQADQFIQVERHQNFEALWTLRCLLQGIDPPPEVPTGAPLEKLTKLAEQMKSCQCGVLFFGLGLARSALGHRSVEALLRLVTDLNEFTRFHARRMRIPGDVTGADSVLCWQTGFPFSVNLSRGYPRYNPGEFSAHDLLERGEVDACLLVGSEGVHEFSATARQHLTNIPTIAIDYPTVEPAIAADVQFTTAVYGIHLPGTAYRMDEMPIPLRSVLPAKYLSDEDLLQAIEQRIAVIAPIPEFQSPSSPRSETALSGPSLSRHAPRSK